MLGIAPPADSVGNPVAADRRRHTGRRLILSRYAWIYSSTALTDCKVWSTLPAMSEYFEMVENLLKQDMEAILDRYSNPDQGARHTSDGIIIVPPTSFPVPPQTGHVANCGDFYEDAHEKIVTGPS